MRHIAKAITSFTVAREPYIGSVIGAMLLVLKVFTLLNKYADNVSDCCGILLYKLLVCHSVRFCRYTGFNFDYCSVICINLCE